MKLNLQCTQPQKDFLLLPQKYRAFVGGYGAGKSETLANTAIMDALQSPKILIGIFAPTYDLLRLINVPRIMNKLEQMGVEYKYNAQQNRITTFGNVMGNFIFRSLDNPERIVGFEIGSACIDELDTLPHEHAEEAFNKVVARCRQRINDNHINRVNVFTTPEGFRFVHKKWVSEVTEQFGMVQASSRSNPFLPDDYVDSLMSNYPASLRDAYIEGKFVNMVTGTVYNSFDIGLNHCDTILDPKEDLYIGIDFNISNTSGIVMVKRGNELHVVDEIIKAYDTKDLCKIIQQRYPTNLVKVYPDASCSQRRTSSDVTDFIILQQHKLKVYVDEKNPRVRDRVNNVNAGFLNMKGERRLKINTKKCPTLSKNLQQQSYNKNGEPDKSSGVDHTNDALGYAICQLMPINVLPAMKLTKF